MRIAFFCDNGYPEMSGIVDSILTTSGALIERGHEIVFVGPHYSAKDYTVVKQTPPKPGVREVVDGITIVHLPSVPLPKSPTGQSHFSFPTGASFSYLKEFKPDIVHTHSPYGVGIEAMRAAKRFHTPLIGTNHTPIEEYYPIGKSMMRKFDAWYYNHCHFMTTPYSELIANMQSVGFHRPARELPNPAPLTLFHAPTPEEKKAQKEKLGLTGPVVLYCGNFFAGKKIDVVLKAAANLLPEFPTLTFVVVGRGEEDGRLKALAHTLSIEKNVVWPGFIPRDKLLPYYQAADVFTIMSEVDTQSLTLMQAFATGLPAVGARARGLPDFLPETCGFLVEPGSVKECTARVRELLHDEKLAAQMSEAATIYVKQFAPEIIATRWLDIYERALVDFSS